MEWCDVIVSDLLVTYYFVVHNSYWFIICSKSSLNKSVLSIITQILSGRCHCCHFKRITCLFTQIVATDEHTPNTLFTLNDVTVGDAVTGYQLTIGNVASDGAEWMNHTKFSTYSNSYQLDGLNCALKTGIDFWYGKYSVNIKVYPFMQEALVFCICSKNFDAPPFKESPMCLTCG